MIVCTDCGFRNKDGTTFCGGCQEFLEWTGEVVRTEPAPTADADEVEDDGEEDRGVVDRVLDAIRPQDGPGEVAAVQSASSPSSAVAADPTEARVDTAAADTLARATGDLSRAEQQLTVAEAEVEATRRAAEDAHERAAAAERERREVAALLATMRSEADELRERIAQEEQAEAAAPRPRRVGRRPGGRPAGAAVDTDDDRTPGAAAPAEDGDEPGPIRVRRQRVVRVVGEASAVEEREPAVDGEAEGAGDRARRVAAFAPVMTPQRELDELEEQIAQTEVHVAELTTVALAASEAAEDADRVHRAAEAAFREAVQEAERARRARALVAAPGVGSARRPTAVAPAPRGAAPSPEVEEPTPDGRVPQAVKPARSRVRSGRQEYDLAPSRKLRPGDLVCGACGEGNAETRNFCRRCGRTLAEAEPVTVPWWRRLVPRRDRSHEAGARPRRRRRRSPVRMLRKLLARLAMVSMLAAAFGITFLPPVRSTVTTFARNVFQTGSELAAPNPVPVRPVRAEASSTLAGHSPQDAINDTSNLWWAEGAEGTGIGETLTVFFDAPTHLTFIGITNGAADPDAFTANPRPRVLRVTFDTGQFADLVLLDQQEFQPFPIDAPGVTTAEIRIVAVHPGQGGTDTSLTAVEFRARG